MIDKVETSAVDATGYILARCRVDAAVGIDGVKVGTVSANEWKRFDVIAGDHAIVVASLDGGAQCSEILHVPAGEQVIFEPLLVPFDPMVGIPGVMTDPSDGTLYRTVKLGAQEWLAENVRSANGGTAPNGQASRIPDFGKLYGINDLPKQPPGWRIPSGGDFKVLTDRYTHQLETLLVGGKSGLNIPLAGVEHSNQEHQYFGSRALFWTTTREQGRYWMLRRYVMFEESHVEYPVFTEGDPVRLSVRFMRDA